MMFFSYSCRGCAAVVWAGIGVTSRVLQRIKSTRYTHI